MSEKPVRQKADGTWYYTDFDGYEIGPFGTKEKAEAEYDAVLAWIQGQQKP